MRRVLGALVLGALGWVLVGEVRRNWAKIAEFHIHLSFRELGLATLLGLGAFLLETRAWQRGINGAIGRTEMRFVESVATVNASGLLKYLPGRVWTYGAQVMWLGKRGIPGAPVVYVNLVCILCSILVSTLLGGVYLALYVLPRHLVWPASLALVVLHAGALLAAPRMITLALVPIRRLTGREIVVAPTPPALMAELGGIYVAVWALMGAAGYYSALGVGLSVTMHDVTAITASMSLSWVVGYLSAVTPGGLGVREGLMYVMLGKTGNVQAALVLPVVSRLLYLVIEVLLGALGLAIGVKQGLFKRGPAAGPAPAGPP